MGEKKVAKKKILNILGIILFLVIMTSYLTITWPHHILKELNGIEYSRDDKAQSAAVSVRIHGTMKQELTGGRVFTGTIELLKTDLAFPNQKITLSFNNADWCSLSFRDLEGALYNYGEMFADEEMSTIVIIEPDTGNAADGIGTGFILAFPADDRETAERMTFAYLQKDRNHYFEK